MCLVNEDHVILVESRLTELVQFQVAIMCHADRDVVDVLHLHPQRPCILRHLLRSHDKVPPIKHMATSYSEEC